MNVTVGNAGRKYSHTPIFQVSTVNQTTNSALHEDILKAAQPTIVAWQDAKQKELQAWRSHRDADNEFSSFAQSIDGNVNYNGLPLIPVSRAKKARYLDLQKKCKTAHAELRKTVENLESAKTAVYTAARTYLENKGYTVGTLCAENFKTYEEYRKADEAGNVVNNNGSLAMLKALKSIPEFNPPAGCSGPDNNY